MEKEVVQGQRPETPTSEKQIEEKSLPGKETKGENPRERQRQRMNMGAKGREALSREP